MVTLLVNAAVAALTAPDVVEKLPDVVEKFPDVVEIAPVVVDILPADVDTLGADNGPEVVTPPELVMVIDSPLLVTVRPASPLGSLSSASVPEPTIRSTGIVQLALSRTHTP